MDRTLVGGLVTAAGLVLLFVAALAEPVGLGNDDGFGLKQTTGVLVGAVLVVAGMVLIYLQRREAKAPQVPQAHT